MDVTAPSVPIAVWVLAFFDPILIAFAVVLGWKADQFGKVFIAAIAAVGAAVLLGWLITALGVPWVAPVGRDSPMLLQVRAAAALVWAALAFGARKLTARR